MAFLLTTSQSSVVLADTPSATTLPANAVTSIGTNASVTFNGMVNPNGLATIAWFEWGSTKYTSKTAATNLGGASVDAPISCQLTGLAAGAAYHFRLVVSNSVGVSRALDQRVGTLLITPAGSNPITSTLNSTFTDPGFLITDAAGVEAIAAGVYHSLALKGDGTAVGWGYDHYGQADVPANLNLTVVAGGY
jgi:hypothetical protein